MKDYEIYSERYAGIGFGVAKINGSYVIILPFIMIGMFRKTMTVTKSKS